MTINCVDTNTHRRTEEHKHTQTDIETPRQKYWYTNQLKWDNPFVISSIFTLLLFTRESRLHSTQEMPFWFFVAQKRHQQWHWHWQETVTLTQIKLTTWKMSTPICCTLLAKRNIFFQMVFNTRFSERWIINRTEGKCQTDWNCFWQKTGKLKLLLTARKLFDRLLCTLQL